MRRLADLYPGSDKTDPRGAFIIADASRTLPHTLRPVGREETIQAETAVLTGFDDDLTAEVTRVTNRLRDALGSQRQARRGNMKLKKLFFNVAWASNLNDDRSREFYQRKKAEGKGRNGALIALARRKADLLHAMLRTGTTYRPADVTERDRCGCCLMSA